MGKQAEAGRGDVSFASGGPPAIYSIHVKQESGRNIKRQEDQND
jgi:hypothetical protein